MPFVIYNASSNYITYIQHFSLALIIYMTILNITSTMYMTANCINIADDDKYCYLLLHCYVIKQICVTYLIVECSSGNKLVTCICTSFSTVFKKIKEKVKNYLGLGPPSYFFKKIHKY